jgi:hypothetical protein
LFLFWNIVRPYPINETSTAANRKIGTPKNDLNIGRISQEENSVDGCESDCAQVVIEWDTPEIASVVVHMEKMLSIGLLMTLIYP